MRPSLSGVDSVVSDGAESKSQRARLTIFSLPKPFDDPEIARVQSNAIRSWLALGDGVEVLLLGDEAGIESFAQACGAKHFGGVKRNQQGTPLINSAFDAAEQIGAGDYLMYCNADVILGGEISWMAEQLGRRWPAGFLAFGRRLEIAGTLELDWSQPETVQRQLEQAHRAGKVAPRVCKEYFLFRRGQYTQLPPFAVGRGNWDNWMVSQSRRMGLPVIDTSQVIQTLHQSHHYAHLAEKAGSRPSRWSCYVSGEEAQANEKLAGGKRLISGSSADWLMRADGRVEPKWLARWNMDFWLDLHRFLGMTLRLPFQR